MTAKQLIAACQSEPIHAPGAIQAWGALLIAGTDDLIVTHASANLHSFLGLPADQAVGGRLQDLVGCDRAKALLDATSDDSTGTAMLAPRASGQPSLTLGVHRLGNRLYIECEPVEPADLHAVAVSPRRLIERLRAADSLPGLFDTACSELRRITGFDRVIVYRFDADQHGEVIAESCAGGMEKLLGLHYPAEDIPQQAWQIFARLPVRVIADSHATPVPLWPACDMAAQPDLSLCALRTPSPCHTEYLRNMGSAATATVALTVDGRLWGILACHHRVPAHLPQQRRSLCELVGQATSMMVTTLRDAEARRDAAASHARLLGISARLAVRGDGPAALADTLAETAADLLALCDAQGAIIRLGGRIASCGMAPRGAAAGALLDALLEVLPARLLGEEARGSVVACDALGEVLDPALLEAPGQPAGALLLPLVFATGDAVAWLRPEQSRSVSWGGNPHQPMSFDTERGRLVPRSSFAVWREQVRGRSLPWTPANLQAASGLRGKIDKNLAGYAESMRVAREAAERATRAKTEFLATMSHEIRSPMSGLLGVLDLLRATELSPEQGRMAGMIHNSASMLLAVLNDILDFSKIEAGALTIALEPVALRDLLQDLVQPHTVAAAKKGLPVRLAVDAGVPDGIVTDPLRLRQILGNLLSNAVKFTAAGEVRLAAGTAGPADAPDLRFTVTDTGIGIGDDVLGGLFAPFTQADGSTTRNFGGTGLGLCISRQLAGLLGGTVGVTSRLDEGSTFTLTIPLVPCSGPVQQPAARDVSGMPVAAAGKRVLVVDDDPTIRWLSQRQLEKLGFVAEVADDGETALRRLAYTAYDLLLIDCHMPRMDGVSLTRAVRASERAELRSLPIVGLTADVTERQRALCQDAGMNELAIKPMTVERLAGLLQRHLAPPAPAPAASGAAGALRQLPFDDQIFLSIFSPGDPEGVAWLSEWLAGAGADTDELGRLLAASGNAPLARGHIATVAHRLAGSSFSVGAVRLGNASRALEHAAPEAGLDLLLEAHRALRDEFAACASAIDVFLEPAAPGINAGAGI